MKSSANCSKRLQGKLRTCRGLGQKPETQENAYSLRGKTGGESLEIRTVKNTYVGLEA
jgi:hypothetical protein